MLCLVVNLEFLTLTLLQEDTEPTPVIRKPNPQNEKNKSTLEELEAEIKRYVRLVCTICLVLTVS
jgi:predicted PurR-regulated permease PerM